MDVQEISKIIQMYTMQNVFTEDKSSSTMFSMIFNKVLEGMENTNNIEINNIKDSINSNQEKNKLPDTFKNVKVDSTSEITKAINDISQKYNMDTDFVKSVVKNESGFNPKAVSGAGAMGLMQLMPKTAEAFDVKNPFDALENLDAGTRYLKNLINTYNGNKEMALSAYNGGSSRMKSRGVDSPDKIYKMPSETKNYVEKVMETYKKYKNI